MKVTEILESEAAKDGLKWNPGKERYVEFGVQGEGKTLRIHINCKLDFCPHVRARSEKAEAILKVMTRPGNSNVPHVTKGDAQPIHRRDPHDIHTGDGIMERPTHVNKYLSHDKG